MIDTGHIAQALGDQYNPEAIYKVCEANKIQLKPMYRVAGHIVDPTSNSERKLVILERMPAQDAVVYLGTTIGDSDVTSPSDPPTDRSGPEPSTSRALHL